MWPVIHDIIPSQCHRLIKLFSLVKQEQYFNTNLIITKDNPIPSCCMLLTTPMVAASVVLEMWHLGLFDRIDHEMNP